MATTGSRYGDDEDATKMVLDSKTQERDQDKDTRTRQIHMPSLRVLALSCPDWQEEAITYSSYGQEQEKQPPEQPHNAVFIMSLEGAPEARECTGEEKSSKHSRTGGGEGEINMRTRRITYTNACRQSNSAHNTKERIYRETLVNLEKKKSSLETEMLGILDRFCHSEGPLAEEFKQKKHNYATMCKEIAYMEGKVNYHLQQQQHLEGG